jgi:hypothetical protein
MTKRKCKNAVLLETGRCPPEHNEDNERQIFVLYIDTTTAEEIPDMSHLGLVHGAAYQQDV